MTYQYKDPLTQGYRRVRLSKAQHNNLFPNRKIKWTDKYEYYLSEDMFLLHKYLSLPAVVLNILLFPISLLCFGLSNFKDVLREHKEILSQKKYGKFSGDACYKSDEDYFNNIVAQVKEW